MDYIKTKITICPPENWFRDVLAVRLSEAGYESFVETETGLEAYIQKQDFSTEKIKGLLAETNDGFKLDWENETIESQNWNEVWEKNYFKPLLIQNRCLVRAPFHTDYPACEYEIVIEPNMAFGTGNHETTSMMIETLLEMDISGKPVLDMGCGTGILSILASKKGASFITAIDIDEWAYSGTLENARINNAGNIEARQGDASLLGEKKFDVILANIQRNVLLADMEKYSGVLNPGGFLAMSGFYNEDLPAIKEKAESLGLNNSGNKIKNNWVVSVYKK